MTESEKASARHKLIVALDYPNADTALLAAANLRGHVGMFKVGSELFCAAGPSIVHDLVAAGNRVFVDLKFHDIPNTVRAAARQVTQLGTSMFTVHAGGGRKMMEAAVQGAREGAEIARTVKPLVLAITVLTSLANKDLEDIGLSGGPDAAVVRLATLAQTAGLDGVVASAQEIIPIRNACGARFTIVTPGIRPALALDARVPGRTAPDDQARIATPVAAIQAGADLLVVGRPITQAPDPAAAADAIVGEMERALAAENPVASGM